MSLARGARLLFAFGLVLAAASPSFAREPTPEERRQARDLFAKAEKDEQAGDWRAALEKLERAGAVKMTAGIRFHIALCRENLGTLPEALADYEAAAAQARADNVAEVLEAVREPLADLRARVPSLSLALINAAPETVDVSVDDRAVSPNDLAMPLRLAPGTHRIVARRKSGGPTFTKDIELKERDVVALDLKLPSEAAPPAPPARATTTPAASAVEAPAPGETPPAEAPERSRTGAVVATAGAVVLVGGGVAAFVLAGSAQDDLHACTNADDCESRRRTVRTFDALALGSWVAGAALGAFATVLWLQPSRTGVAFGGNRAALVGRF